VIDELKKAGVSKLSVSLNGHDEQSYNEICRPTLRNAYSSILEFIAKARQKLEVEITAVRLPEIDLLKIEKLASELGVSFRPRDYIPCFY
jgi:TatD family-associated radical SAM protein